MSGLYKKISLLLVAIIMFAHVGFAYMCCDYKLHGDSFLKLRAHNVMRFDDNGREVERLEALKSLTPEEFAFLLEYLFSPKGGEAVKHWAYNPLKSTNELRENTHYHKDHEHKNGFEEDHFYITPAVRASQYIIFLLEYNVTSKDEQREQAKQIAEALNVMEPDLAAGIYNSPKKAEQRARAKKVAAALNLMDSDRAIEMLYGRFDARFLGDRDRLVETALVGDGFGVDNPATYRVVKPWLYETRDEAQNVYYPQQDIYLDLNTVEARVPLSLIHLLVPYVKDELLRKMVEKEDEMSAKGLRVEL